MTDARYPEGSGRPQRSASDTRSSYEEAIRRSNERLNRIQRRPSYSAEPSQQSRPSVAPQRTSARTSSTRPSSGRPRQTIKLGDYHDYDAPQPSAYQQQAQTQRRSVQQRPAQQRPAVQPAQQRGFQLPERRDHRQPAVPSSYHEQQMQARSRDSGNYQARPKRFSPNLPSLPIPQNGLLVRAVICLVLLIVVVFSITRIGPATGALGEAQTNVQTQQEQLDTLNKQNEDLQGQLENMQGTIDKYNDIVAKNS